MRGFRKSHLPAHPWGPLVSVVLHKCIFDWWWYEECWRIGTLLFSFPFLQEWLAQSEERPGALRTSPVTPSFWGQCRSQSCFQRSRIPRKVKEGVAQVTKQVDSTLATVATRFKCTCSDSETAPPLATSLGIVSLFDAHVIWNAEQYYYLARANANWERGLKWSRIISVLRS